MNYKNMFFAVSAVIVLLLGLSIYQFQQAGKLRLELAAVSKAVPIQIATAGPMTGQYASFGEQMRRGAEMAIQDINAAGGVMGQKLALSIGDDACDPKQAVAVANKFVSDGIVFVAGHFCSGSSIPASKVYTEENILQISPASTNPKLTEEGGDNVFRTCGRDDQQGIVAGNYLVDKFKGKKIAILHDKTAYGKGLADETKKQLNKRGVEEAMYEAYTAGEKDYSAIVTKMKGAGIDLFYLGGYHTEAGLMVRQAREQGYGVQLVSGDALVTDEYWKITGPAGEGTLMTFSPDPRKDPAAAGVVKKFRGRRLRARGLHPLHLRRHPGLGGRGDQGRIHGHGQGGRLAPQEQVQYRSRQHRFRHEGRRDRARLCVLRVEKRHL